MTLQNLNIKENPFEFLTPIQGKIVFWAGMKEIKNNIEGIYKSSFENNPRNLILNWGPIGGGKTYAAYYFKNTGIKEYDSSQLINIYCRTPKDGTKITKQIFLDVLDGITFRVLKQLIQTVYKEMGEERLFEYIYENINSEEFTQAVVNLGKEEDIFNMHIFDLMKKYIFGTINSKELSSLKLFRKLESDTDYRKFLSGIILAITASKKPKRVFFWLDELEDLLFVTSKQYKEFFQIIRDLVDTVGEKFTVFMNFTFSDSEEENVRILIGEALWSRINKRIYFKPLDLPAALTYCKDLLQYSQIDTNKGDYSPFEEATITELLSNIRQTDLIPREINRNINDIIQFALNKEQTIINIELYKEWFNSKSTF